MPQFDPTWYASQIFWVLVTFNVLFFVVSRFVAPKIATTLDARKNKIDGDLKAAEHFKTEAEHALAEYQKALKNAQIETLENFAKAQEQIMQQVKSKEADFDERLKEKIAQNEATLAAEKKQALAGMKNLARALTEDIVKQLAGIEADSKDVKQKIAAIMEKSS